MDLRSLVKGSHKIKISLNEVSKATKTINFCGQRCTTNYLQWYPIYTNVSIVYMTSLSKYVDFLIAACVYFVKAECVYFVIAASVLPI